MPPVVPRYYQAKTRLSELVNGIPDGSPFPSERELAGLLGMSRTTVRKALDDLVLQGRLIRRAGRQGTVVAARTHTHRLSVAAVVHDLVTCRPITARLVDTADDLVLLEWVLLTEHGEPIGLRSTHLPEARFPGLLERYSPTTPLRRFLQDHYGVRYAEAQPWCTTVLATPRIGRLLDVRPTSPMLSLTWVSRDTDGHPIERSWTALRGDRTHLTVR